LITPEDAGVLFTARVVCCFFATGFFVTAVAETLALALAVLPDGFAF